MATVYEALQRGRQEAGQIAPPLPRMAKPQPTRFGPEMRLLSSRLQPLIESCRPATIGITATGAGEGTSTVVRELAYHLAGEGKSVLVCGDTADFDAVRSLAETDTTGVRPIIETTRDGLKLVDIADLYRRDSGGAAKTGFRDWLTDHARNFDLIIIDVPPLLENQSWGGLMGFPDAMLIVVEAERSRSAIVKATATIITEAKGNILGMVMNKRRQYIPRSLYKWL